VFSELSPDLNPAQRVVAATTTALLHYVPVRHAYTQRRACDVLIADPFLNEIVIDMADRRKLQGEREREFERGSMFALQYVDDRLLHTNLEMILIDTEYA